jgi:sugar-specific transcriptional regulator TrmB
MEKQLKEAGLTAKEAAAYLAVLHGGRLTLAGIAKATKINRTSLYRTVEQLLKRDYLSKEIRGKRLYYVAENPTKILRSARKKQASLEALVPLMLEVYRTVNVQPTVKTYEGADGLLKVFIDAFEVANYTKTFFSPGKFDSVLNMRKGGRVLLDLMREKGFRAQGLCADNPEGHKFMREYKGEHIEVRLMPHGIDFPVEFMIYNQNLIIASYEHLFAVVIESPDIKQFIETLWDHFWRQAKPRKR